MTDLQGAGVPGTAAGASRPPGGDSVSWATAVRVATWISERTPMPPGYASGALDAQFAELTARAEQLVGDATGWVSPAGPATARVIDRAGWVAVNVASFRRMLGPHLDRLDMARRLRRGGVDGAGSDGEAGSGSPPEGTGARLAAALGEGVQRATGSLTRNTAGAQMGAILGWMSSKVLGQYDLLLTEDVDDEQDVVYFVGPNIVALEQRHGFDPAEFRLWLALHEVTHRCQFTAVPWIRDHFVSLVNEGLGALQPDPSQFAAALRRVTEEIRAGRNPLAEAGALGLVVGPEQLEVLHRIQALMSLLEGHGDITMDRAGLDAVPNAERFSRVLRERRAQAKGAARLMRQLLGLEAKLRQYAEGERFIAAVESEGGRELFDRVWEGPEMLPSLGEIRDPQQWIARVARTSTLTA